MDEIASGQLNGLFFLTMYRITVDSLAELNSHLSCTNQAVGYNKSGVVYFILFALTQRFYKRVFCLVDTPDQGLGSCNDFHLY